jgi:hypothetical protein
MDLTGYPLDMSSFFGGAIIGALLAVGVVLVILIVLALYIYTALAWQTIAKKLGYKKAWLAWIPIANFFLLPILARKDKDWVYGFLFLVPFVNIVMSIIWTWKIFERRKYPGWFSLAPIIPEIGGILMLVALGFVAWQNKLPEKKSKGKK